MNSIGVYQHALAKQAYSTTGVNLSITPTSQVRREYLKLPSDLAALTRGFGIELRPQLQADAAVLAFSIECTDRLLDAIPQADQRERFGHAVTTCLRGEASSNEPVTAELSRWLSRLKEVAERHGIEEEFRDTVQKLLKNSERMRTTRNEARFVACAVREGRLMVELLLLILKDVSTPQFDSFMRQLGGAANLGDKLRDARRDFRSGEIALRPGMLFHACVMREMLARTIGLLGLSGMSWHLLRWGIKSFFSEFIWFPFSRSHSH